MFTTYRAPQTEDGCITEVQHAPRGGLLLQVEFQLDREFLDELDGRRDGIQFAARSRIARLGIDIRPRGKPEIEGDRATLLVTARAAVASYQLHELLEKVFLPDLPVGRLVYCKPERRLTSEQAFQAYTDNDFKLPAAFSIDADGRFSIQPHRVVYDLVRPPTVDDLFAILLRPEGRSLLNRLQVERRVDNILLEPGEGVITSCAMFLHRHYVVLESDPTALGRHMHAIVLDPISTRGPRVFLEFFNDSETAIVNPTVTGVIYAAEPTRRKVNTWDGPINGRTHIDPSLSASEYVRLSQLFEEHSAGEHAGTYFDRAVAILPERLGAVDAESTPVKWSRPLVKKASLIDAHAAKSRVVSEKSSVKHFGTKALRELEANSNATLLLTHFPNLAEHLDIAAAAAEGKIRRLIFQKASFEHGPFLSSRDHARLVDYTDLGVDVFWCNEHRHHVAVHVFRGHRGFFCELHKVDGFKNALVVATYGSSRSLPEAEAEKVRGLIAALRNFFGEDLAILTGGGPGAMREASEIAKSLDLLVGASFLEIENQQPNQIADFYQVFQENCRHSRQRWFEISSFHIFLLGGVGTLEEIGITLTDIKLGITDGTPLVFFGKARDELYWAHLVEQLRLFAAEHRGPEWLRTHVLVTDNPEEVISFYKRILSLG